MDEYKKHSLPKLTILGFIGLFFMISISPIALIFRLDIGGIGDAILIGAASAFFCVLIMLGLFQDM